jgi:pimeloyl-ACP methyl ester carboxylesterase
MGAITMPTAYLWSTDDPALGRDAADATAACVEGPYRFEVFDDVGHWIAEQAPERTTAVLLDQLALA